ncbi:MAG: Hsp20/alpha crystallin family protein [Opitutales bacterium]|nr:Hsp20/alpha crystallin family protein [Opitutales bacterium]
MRLIKYDNIANDAWSELDRMFERAFSDAGAWPGFWGRRSLQSFRLDSYQDEANHYIVAELPGFDRKDIQVELENEVLTISAKRESEGEEGASRESSLNVSRSVAVEKAIQADKVQAKLENGLLTVTLPKAEERRPRMIEVS